MIAQFVATGGYGLIDVLPGVSRSSSSSSSLSTYSSFVASGECDADTQRLLPRSLHSGTLSNLSIVGHDNVPIGGVQRHEHYSSFLFTEDRN